MKQKGRLLVVSNRLPVTLSCEEGKWKGCPASGGLVSAMNPVLKNRGGFWAGWPGTGSGARLADIRDILGPVSEESGYRFLPVILTEDDVHDFYHGYSNSVLWPLFHDLQSRCDFSPRYWDGYVRSNAKFARVVLRHASEDDFIWVNDYQLIPLGAMLREKQPGLRTSFFLHIPFPSVDVFMKMPRRREILDQMTRYSFMCFQTGRDRKNFLDCLRVFHPDCQVSGRGHIVKVRLGDRSFSMGSLPISIDYQAYSSLGGTRHAVARAKEIRQEIFGEKFILGVDRLDYSKGIPEKLRGFRRCLELYPELRERITLHQVVVPSRETVEQYQALKEEIELLISRINGEFSTTRWVPVNWHYGSVSREELAAMYRAADMALVTSLKDGMNLVCKEYCACKGREKGVLILSEFAGAALQLARGAVLVNPYDVDAVAGAVRRAFFMDDREKKERMRFLRKSIARQDVFWWVDNFLRAAAGKKLEDFPEQAIPSLWPGVADGEQNDPGL